MKIKEDERIKTRYLIPGSFGVACINTFCVMPFDNIKTQMQRFNLPEQSFYNAYKFTTEQRGFGGLWVGWRFRLTHYMFSALFTVDLLEKMERDSDFYMFHFKTVWCPQSDTSHDR